MQPNQSVLLVNDNLEYLHALTGQFRDIGINLSTAADGLDGLILAVTETPDLIVLDIDLPGADGLKICEKLGQHAPTSNIPVIILTDKSDEETLQRCKFLRAHYVYKDLGYWNNLRSMICDHLGVSPAPADQTNLEIEASLQIPAVPSAPKILVIDDDPQITRALKIRLGAIGLDVIEAPNAAGGNYLAWTERPDLIITDQNMPEMSGENLIVKLKNDEETKNIPIIVITGQTVNGQEDFGLKRDMLGTRGAVAYLTKPLDFNELVRAIQNHIQIPSPPSGSAESGAPPILRTGSKRG
jgi:DNA-binding response OmpR family regulator